MKHIITAMTLHPSFRILAGLGIVLSLCLAGPTAGFACHKGGPHGQETSCDGSPPPAGDITLDITYEFGALSNDVCVAPDCVVTTITATAPLVCGTNSCEFKSTSVVDETFSLPAGLRHLLFETKWQRKQDLDPDGCFGSSDADEVGTALIDGNIVFLRRYNDDATPWEASVGTWARDILDIEDRTHIFNFVGCGAESCGAFAPGSMEGIYEGGKLTRIDGPGNDRKFLSIPCRCTVSNTPDCPVDVPVPTPELRITVVDVTP